MLSKFTDDELREELKRRAKERRMNMVRKPTEYITLTGIVKSIDNVAYNYRTDGVKYKPFNLWTFKLTEFECDEPKIINWCFRFNDFKCQLPKAKSPNVGDKVLIKIRKTKHISPYNVRTSKIKEVINQ